MDQELQNLIHRLREEKCPPSVLFRVHERIALENAATRSRATLLPWALAVAVVLGVAVLWPWQARRDARRLAAEAKSRRERVFEETQVAFGYIGHALNRAAAHTETALTKQAAQPIRTSFELIKNKLPNPL